jgi:hypothetical protein
MKARQLICTGTALAIVLALSSSRVAMQERGGAGAPERTGTGAGPGEKTFSERYGLNLALPIDEEVFINTLNRLKLRYELYGERGSGREIPPSRHASLDLERILRCYQIYGGLNARRGVGATYRAYVNDERKIVYIENAFEYIGP